MTKPVSQYSTFKSHSICCYLIVFSEFTILSALKRKNLCCCSAESGTLLFSHYSVKQNSLQPHWEVNVFMDNREFNAQQRRFWVFCRCLIKSSLFVGCWLTDVWASCFDNAVGFHRSKRSFVICGEQLSSCDEITAEINKLNIRISLYRR